MKRNDWLFAAGILSYSYLFYQQFAGINFLLFTLVLIITLCMKNSYLLLRRSVWLPLAGAIISATCICIYGKGLAVFANICSLSILSIRFMDAENSLFTSLIHSAFSYLSAPVYMCITAVKRFIISDPEKTDTRKKGFFFYLIPLIAFLLFFLLYRGSSALFKNLTDHINLDFISAGWIFFTIYGSILLFGFYYAKRITILSSLEGRLKDGIEPSGISTFNFVGNVVNITTEQKSGIMMLSLLNLLILVVNMLDVQFLLLGSVLPEGMTHSELVHEGIDSLITSIIVAVAIILWYFRGEQNFTKGNTLKVLAYVWIAQNVVMVCFNAYKNGLYIEESSLTYKRIGVFVYLLLATIGLILTAIKIKNTRSNWYLLKTNVTAFYIVLLVSCFVNWDLLITRFNIEQSETKKKPLDVQYIALLSASVIPDLYQWMDAHKGAYEPYLKEMVNVKIIDLIEDRKSTDWRSWNMEDARIITQLNALFDKQVVDGFTLYDYQTLTPYHHRLRLVSLKTSYPQRLNVYHLASFTAAESLDLSYNELTSIQGIPAFHQLKKLDLSNNSLVVIHPVSQLTSLEELNVSLNNITKLPDLSALINLKSLDVSGNSIEDLSPLAGLVNAEHINVYNNRVKDFTPLKKLTHLKTLNAFMSKAQKEDLRKALPQLIIINSTQ
jgi:hypothetical protein